MYAEGLRVASSERGLGLHFVLSQDSVRLFVGSKDGATAAIVPAPIRTSRVLFRDSKGTIVRIRGCSVIL